jgi:hypothetical protein
VISNIGNSVDSWRLTSSQAAEQAKRYRPIALWVFVVAAANLALEYVSELSWVTLETTTRSAWLEVINVLLIRLLEVSPAIALMWALWDSIRYLGQLEQGAIWSAPTLRFLHEVGQSLIWSAALSIVIAPTLMLWITTRGGGVDFRLEGFLLALLGVGFLLRLLAQVFSQVLESAQQIKAENESFI